MANTTFSIFTSVGKMNEHLGAVILAGPDMSQQHYCSRAFFVTTLPSAKISYLLVKQMYEVWGWRAAELYRNFLDYENNGAAEMIYTSSAHVNLPRGERLSLLRLRPNGHHHNLRMHGGTELIHFPRAFSPSLGNYYVPISPVNSTFDAFYVHTDRTVYVFRVTIRKSHNRISATELDLLADAVPEYVPWLPGNAKWRYVFVVTEKRVPRFRKQKIVVQKEVQARWKKNIRQYVIGFEPPFNDED
ncbi:hypothetical protein EUX98_g7222 [Antrodiella citrinella]|uniref:Uncharacterized protein n=1 Tax=Antrodiella citrinella TaxID=2447956 RepID=A0A4S4MUG2_9APHY|nr:hypothetical protein EUX98_g7222 [Antrodiella citrinella]